jgi:Fe-S cluster assembly protein SufD
MSVMPTRKAEDWRYADLAALERLWPLDEPEAITVAAGGSFARSVINTDGVVRLAITLKRAHKRRSMC